MMIGPSAPNGPPVPIEIAEESGFRTATLGCIRLPPIRIASIASGMPWPRIFSEPNRAIKPMTSPPSAGASTIQSARTGVRQRNVLGAEVAEPDEIGDKRNQLRPAPRRPRHRRADDQRHADQQQHAAIRREIAELAARTREAAGHVGGLAHG